MVDAGVVAVAEAKSQRVISNLSTLLNSDVYWNRLRIERSFVRPFIHAFGARTDLAQGARRQFSCFSLQPSQPNSFAVSRDFDLIGHRAGFRLFDVIPNTHLMVPDLTKCQTSASKRSP